MVKKETSKMTKMFFKEENKVLKCEVCGIELCKEKRKYKVMEFENGLIKNLLKDNNRKVISEFGEITTIEGKHIALCKPHLDTVWSMKGASNTWEELIEYCKANKKLIISKPIDLAVNEVNKEINEAICSGSLEL